MNAGDVIRHADPATLTVMADRLPMPASFDGDANLLALNLFVMTAFTYLGLMVVGAMASGIWRNRKWDCWNHPVTLHRAMWCCAGCGMTLRCGAEAAFLWAWDPLATRVRPEQVALATQMQELKRHLDPISLMFAGGWLVLLVISHEAMVQQLRKQPFPIEMWARLPSLIRPAVIVLLSAVMAFGVVWTRG